MTATARGKLAIGVLGGIGPQPTVDFERMVHEEAPSFIEPHLNQGSPPMVTVYLRHAPVVLAEDGRPREPLALDPRVLEAARRLGEWADFIVVVSNTPHLFLDEIHRAAGREVASMVDVTVEELRRRGPDPVGLTGLGIPRIYSERLETEKINFLVPPSEVRDRLDDAILRLMEGKQGDAHRRAAREAVKSVRAQGVSAVVLGCTEIPLLPGPEAGAPDLVHPARLLARAAVRRAVEGAC
jgi:aspartate racemase